MRASVRDRVKQGLTERGFAPGKGSLVMMATPAWHEFEEPLVLTVRGDLYGHRYGGVGLTAVFEIEAAPVQDIMSKIGTTETLPFDVEPGERVSFPVGFATAGKLFEGEPGSSYLEWVAESDSEVATAAQGLLDIVDESLREWAEARDTIAKVVAAASAAERTSPVTTRACAVLAIEHGLVAEARALVAKLARAEREADGTTRVQAFERALAGQFPDYGALGAAA